MNAQNREAAILDEVRQNLIAEGYEVIVQPNSLLVPSFLGGFRPDALAFRSDKNLVIEVATQSPAATRRLQDLQSRMSQQKQWELRLIWAAPGDKAHSLQKASKEEIGYTIHEVRELCSQGHYRPALLLGWAALEGVTRMLLPEAVARPQSPARLIEQLAASGRLSPDEADKLRGLISKRNRLIHGELRTDIRKKDVTSLVGALQLLFEELAN